MLWNLTWFLPYCRFKILLENLHINPSAWGEKKKPKPTIFSLKKLSISIVLNTGLTGMPCVSQTHPEYLSNPLLFSEALLSRSRSLWRMLKRKTRVLPLPLTVLKIHLSSLVKDRSGIHGHLFRLLTQYRPCRKDTFYSQFIFYSCI